MNACFIEGFEDIKKAAWELLPESMQSLFASIDFIFGKMPGSYPFDTP